MHHRFIAALAIGVISVIGVTASPGVANPLTGSHSSGVR